MHTLITYAAPPGPQCKAALQRLVLPNLRHLLRHLSPGARLQEPSDHLTPVYERVQAQSQGLDGADGLIPWAALEAQRRGLTAVRGLDGWAWITPCHWRVQSDHVEMTDPLQLALTPHDSEALHLAMQPYFAEDGITLFAHAHGQTHSRWLAHGAVFANLPTASLDRVAGQAVDTWLPRQPQAQPLRRLQNEMQMLLYTHPVNDQRASFHLPSINAFWVSGTGALPAPTGAPVLATPCAVRDALRLPALADDAAAWTTAWQALDASTLARDLAHVQQGKPLQLTLCSETQALTLDNRPLGPWDRVRRRLAPLRPKELLQTL